jgi:hypothetical protein
MSDQRCFVTLRAERAMIVRKPCDLSGAEPDTLKFDVLATPNPSRVVFGWLVEIDLAAGCDSNPRAACAMP